MRAQLVHAAVAAAGVASMLLMPAGACAQPVPLLPVQEAPVADQPPSLPSTPAPAPMGEDQADPGKDCVRVTLKDGSSIIGELPEDATVSLTGKFGKVEIAMHDVARIEPAVTEGELRITLSNGDRLTGRVKFGDLKVIAKWGGIPLAVVELVSLEAGKLHEQTLHETQLSPDGRTAVTIGRKRMHFEPVIQPQPQYPTTTQPGFYGSPYQGGAYQRTPAFSAPRVVVPAPIPSEPPAVPAAQ